MPTKSVEIPEIGIVKLSKRKGVKNLRLSISHDGAIRVSMPFWLPFASGLDFVKKQHEWIVSNQIKSVPLLDGLKIGKSHRLNFIAKHGVSKTISRITSSGEIKIYYPANKKISDINVQQIAAKAAHRALRLQAEKLLNFKLSQLANYHGFSYRNFKVKTLKSRWGSCSSEKDIVLNIFLIQLPWHLIEYVIMHELVHTKIMAHGALFWKELDKYVPDLRAVRKEIKDYRPVLMTEV